MSVAFKAVRIRRNYKGDLVGELEIEGDFGSAELNLTNELCTKIMLICADSIVDAAQETATKFRHEALQINAHEAKVIEE